MTRRKKQNRKNIVKWYPRAIHGFPPAPGTPGKEEKKKISTAIKTKIIAEMNLFFSNQFAM